MKEKDLAYMLCMCRHKTNFVGLPLVNENFWSVPGQVYFDF